MFCFILYGGKWNNFVACRFQNFIFPYASQVAPSANAGDSGSIPVLGRSPGGGHGNPLQYSRLGNPMDRGAWGMTVHGVTQSQMWPSNWRAANSSVLSIRRALQRRKEDSRLQGLVALPDSAICGLPTGATELTKCLKPCLYIFFLWK